MIFKKSKHTYPWGLIGSAFLISVLGLLNLYSASRVSIPGAFYKQIIWFAISILVAIPFVKIDYRVFERISIIIWSVVVLMLVAVLFTKRIGGSHRWIILGPVRFQPSEFAKMAVVFAIASYVSNREVPGLFSLKSLIRPLGYILIPAALIIMEPDLGTALLIVFIGGTMLLIAGIERKTLVGFVVVALIAVPLFWSFGLKPYQKARIKALISGSDTSGSGYHTYQSLIAVGSGRLTGKGFMRGTQNQMRFLPEQHTDFVFAVFAEEFGFLGAAAVILLYTIFIIMCLRIAIYAREKFGLMLAVGITAIFFFQMLINIAMVIGLLPVVGMTLPLWSYGGSSLLISVISIALLINMHQRRQMF